MEKDPCASCGGTGAIRCTHCGGSGINLNSSLLNDSCRSCNETGREVCRECQGTGQWHLVAIAAASRE